MINRKLDDNVSRYREKRFIFIKWTHIAVTKSAVQKVHTSVTSVQSNRTKYCTSLLIIGQIEYVFAPSEKGESNRKRH